MKPGVLAAGLAAFFGVGTFLWLPLGTPAVQTLMEQGAAAGIAGDLNSRATPNGVRAAERARRVLGALKVLADEARSAQAESAATKRSRAAAPAPPPPPAPALPAGPLSPGEVARLAAPQQAKGRLFVMVGRVAAVDRVAGRTYYRLSPDPSMGMKPGDSLLIQVPRGEASEGEVGQRVKAYGVYDRLEKSRKGARLFAFAEGQMISRIAPGSPPSAPAPAPAAASPAASSYSGPLGGWTLEGTVSSEGGGTAVVVSPEGKPLFLSPGQVFGDNIRLTAVRDGEASFLYAGERLTLAAW